MSNLNDLGKYDEVLTSILENEKSIMGFLSAIFNFLARRTDFYYVPEGPYVNMGFPQGVAEELVVKVLRACDPKNLKAPYNGGKPKDMINEIMCSTVAQEVEISAAEEEDIGTVPELTVETEETTTIDTAQTDLDNNVEEEGDNSVKEVGPPVIPLQKNSESYNGAVRDKYTWSQNIMELDVIVNLPTNIKSAKHLKVKINPSDVCVSASTGDVILQGNLPFKIKPSECLWSISEGRLLMHLEKVQERWWNKFLEDEEAIDLSAIDCSRPLTDLPEDHIAKVRELQWNHEQKMKGLPTSDELKNIEILKKAWNVEGSPFKGKQFDPSIFHHS